MNSENFLDWPGRPYKAVITATPPWTTRQDKSQTPTFQVTESWDWPDRRTTKKYWFADDRSSGGKLGNFEKNSHLIWDSPIESERFKLAKFNVNCWSVTIHYTNDFIKQKTLLNKEQTKFFWSSEKTNILADLEIRICEIAQRSYPARWRFAWVPIQLSR